MGPCTQVNTSLHKAPPSHSPHAACSIPDWHLPLPPPPHAQGSWGALSWLHRHGAVQTTWLKALLPCPEILNAWPRRHTYCVVSPAGTCEAGYTSSSAATHDQRPFQPAPAQQASLPAPGDLRNAEKSIPLRACHTAFFGITKICSLWNFINVYSFPDFGSPLLFPWSSFSFSFEMYSDFTDYECPTESCLFPSAVNMRGRHMPGRQPSYRI